MNKLKSFIFYMGIALLLCGVVLAIVFNGSDGVMRILPFVMVGFGSGIIVVGVSFMIRHKNPKLAKEYEINEKDERNIRLREKSGYSAWFITQFTLFAMVISFLLMDYKVPLWFALGALLIHNGSLLMGIFVHSKKI